MDTHWRWVFLELISEHAAMKEQLRYRSQHDEPAPEDEKVLECFSHSTPEPLYSTCRGRGVFPDSHWIPIPPLNKE